MAGAAIVTAKLSCIPLREQRNELMDLNLQQSVLISLWSEAGDLFDAANNPNGEPTVAQAITDEPAGSDEESAPAEEPVSIE
jgi:hypothetical protein